MKTQPESLRCVVLHADDFGMNESVNAGILRAFREGVLTSTSLLANAPSANEACAAWPSLEADVRAEAIPSAPRRAKLGDRSLPFDIGIHLNLTQGQPISSKAYPVELLDERGWFPGIGTVFRRLKTSRTRFRAAVWNELTLQVEWMLDHGVRPTHLNGHQYVELVPGVAELIPELARRYSIQVVRTANEPHLVRTVLSQGRVGAFAIALVKRHYAMQFQRRLAATGIASPSCFFGTSHAGLVDLSTLHRFLKLASFQGCTEIGLHPATDSGSDGLPPSNEWFDPLAADRPRELDWLCGSIAPESIAGYGLELGRLRQLAK